NYRGDFHLLAHSVERHDSSKKHPGGIASFSFSTVVIEHGLEPASRTITEIAHRATGKRSKTAAAHEFLVSEVPPQKFDAVFRDNFAVGAVLHSSPVATRPCNHPGIGRQKRIASHALAAFYRFQQESVGRVARNPDKGSDRRLQISEHGADYRHDVTA